GTVVQQQATVQLDNVSIGNESLTLNALLDYTPSGGLRNLNGNNSWGTGTTAIAINNSFTGINVNPGTQLTLNATLSGTGLVKLGTGTLALGGTGANTYTGNTVVTAGTLLLNKTVSNAAVPGANLVLNPGTLVQLALTDNQIGAGTSVRVLSGATLDLNNHNTTITDLTLQGSTVQTGGGTLTLNGSVHVNGASTASTISGIVSLSNPGHNFNVADGSAADDLLL